MGDQRQADDWMILFAPHTRNPFSNRKWDKWHLLADYLTEKQQNIAILGTSLDYSYNEWIIENSKRSQYLTNWAGQTKNHEQLRDVIKGCDLLITVNSYIMHLGVALKVRMIAIIGNTKPEIVLPKGIPFVYSYNCKDIPLESVIELLNLS